MSDEALGVRSGKTLLVVGAAIALGIVGAAAWRSASPAYDIPRHEVRAVKTAHAWFAAAPTVPAADSAVVLETIARAEILTNQPDAFVPSEEMQHSLASMVATWIGLRADADADAYAEWMRSRGYTLALDHPDGRSHYSMQDRDLRNAWKFYTGNDASDDLATIDPGTFFRIAFERSLSMKTGYHRPSEVSSRVQIAYMAIPITRPDPRPVGLNDWPEADYWEGNSVSGDRPHWIAPVTYRDVLQRDRVALTAVVFIAVRSANGHWTPMSVACYYDLAAGEWHIESASYSNTLRRGIAIER